MRSTVILLTRGRVKRSRDTYLAGNKVCRRGHRQLAVFALKPNTPTTKLSQGYPNKNKGQLLSTRHA